MTLINLFVTRPGQAGDSRENEVCVPEQSTLGLLINKEESLKAELLGFSPCCQGSFPLSQMLEPVWSIAVPCPGSSCWVWL